MADLSDNFETLTDTDFAVDVAVVFAAFLGTALFKSVAEGFIPMDLPDAVYGIAVIVLAEMAGTDFQRPAQLGAGFYTADRAASRVNLQQRVQNAAAQMGGS